MGRLLVLMGSGETTPTMVTPHQRVFAAAGDGERLILDTPYGFQENADELSARTLEYFALNVGKTVEIASLRNAASSGLVKAEIVATRVREAAWVFAGPGSPSYFARQLLMTSLPAALRARLLATDRDSATVFASAAACTVGRLAIPVYELYKVGEEPRWCDGLDLLAPLGLHAVVVPHYDNAEGGTHDTSCCYIGERRLRILESELDPATWILGIDEHTAAIIDLDARELTVQGRGRVVARVRGAEHVVEAGQRMLLDDLLEVVARLGAVRSATLPTPASPQPSQRRDAFSQAVSSGDLIRAAEVIAEELHAVDAIAPAVRDELVQHVAAIARIAQAGMHQHRDLVAPHVETLLALRTAAREERRFVDADEIRDALTAAGVEVRDGDGDTRWEFTDPLAEALDTRG